MDDSSVQKMIEKYKMTILVGLANLKREELNEGTLALDIVYQHFQDKHRLSQYALG